MIDIFKALAEESRLRILALLLEREMCVCEIEECLHMTQSNASRHLTALKGCGILHCNKKAQWAYYRINDTFKKDEKELWEYLQVKLKELPTYHLDNQKSIECRASNLCASNRKPH
ncbi:MAG TPA: metalloregulator ArsR/SmtB family transcription factor [Lachnospiraceae bacterium]|nr:metalloregulator ArsR/SmtB family transcription factor [Lachnospiraceae bacterium]